MEEKIKDAYIQKTIRIDPDMAERIREYNYINKISSAQEFFIKAAQHFMKSKVKK